MTHRAAPSLACIRSRRRCSIRRGKGADRQLRWPTRLREVEWPELHGGNGDMPGQVIDDIAIHEAGHAVVGVSVGLEVVAMTLAPPMARFSQVSVARVSRRANMAVAAAGHLAEERHSGAPTDSAFEHSLVWFFEQLGNKNLLRRARPRVSLHARRRTMFEHSPTTSIAMQNGHSAGHSSGWRDRGRHASWRTGGMRSRNSRALAGRLLIRRRSALFATRRVVGPSGKCRTL